MSTERRCFLISPIGADGSAERAHADDVYEYIVKPAMEQCQIEAVRSDQLLVPGEISDQMFREIAKSDLCIAVLTGRNPNVYYELAVAHALARPVIILLLKGEELPFDLKDTRCVYYDLSPRPLFERVYSNEVAAHVDKLAEMDWRVPNRLGPVIGAKPNELQLFDRAEDLGPAVWMELLASARRRFDAMGVSLWSWWTQTEGFTELLTRKAEQGCRIRFLVADPDSPAFAHLSRIELDPAERQRTRAAIAATLERLQPLRHQFPDFDVRQLRQGIPHHQFTRTDDVAVAIPYWHSISPTIAPALRCTSTAAMYRLLVGDFEALWSLNASTDS